MSSNELGNVEVCWGVKAHGRVRRYASRSEAEQAVRENDRKGNRCHLVRYVIDHEKRTASDWVRVDG